MLLTWLESLSSIGLFSDVDISFDGGFSVNSYDVSLLAFFLIALLNIYLVVKFLAKKVI